MLHTEFESGERVFIRGSDPANGDAPGDILLWLEQASRLPGAAPLKVAVQLSRFSQLIGRTNNLLVFKGSNVGDGMSRSSVHKALRVLAGAGLVDLRPRRGKGSSVDLLLDAKSDDKASVALPNCVL